jgi:hypothetical protein
MGRLTVGHKDKDTSELLSVGHNVEHSDGQTNKQTNRYTDRMGNRQRDRFSLTLIS